MLSGKISKVVFYRYWTIDFPILSRNFFAFLKIALPKEMKLNKKSEKYATTYCELMPYLCFRQSNVNYNLIEIMR